MSVNKKEARVKRHKRIRKKIQGTASVPRLCVFKSLKHIYAQLVNDDDKKTILTVSTTSKDLKTAVKGKKNIEAAKKVAELLSKKTQELGLKKLVFDRSGYQYHGKVKMLVDTIREAGIKI